MPKEKKPIERLQHLNDIFNTETGAQSVVQVEDLVRRLGISLRQLRIDMDKLRNMGAPLEYDARLRGWRYTEKFFYSDAVPFTTEDLLHLRVGIELFSKTNLIHRFNKLPDAFQKLQNAIRKWTEREASKKAIFFDPLPHYEGAAHLAFFLKAIEEQRSVRFSYQPFHTDQPKIVLFDPYFLRHYERRWYAGGRSHDPAEGFVRTFPLERISGEPQFNGFFHDKPANFDPASYWRHIYGITVPPGAAIENVVLQFSALQGKYFQSTPFVEPYEVLEETPAALKVRLELMINIDLIRKLASFGPDVRVLAPHHLAETLKTFFRRAAGLYDCEE